MTARRFQAAWPTPAWSDILDVRNSRKNSSNDGGRVEGDASISTVTLRWISILFDFFFLLSIMTSWLQLAHRTAIVTGAASGIGAAGELYQNVRSLKQLDSISMSP